MRFNVPVLAAMIIAAPTAFAWADGHGHSHGEMEATTAGSLTLSDAFARASSAKAKAGAAFLTIANDGATDKLIAASADMSEVIELHTHINEGGMMRMRRVDAIDVTGGALTKLQPGGLHVMLIGLKAPLREGESFPLTLTFETAGSVTIDVPVKAPGAMSGHGGHDHRHGHGHDHHINN